MLHRRFLATSFAGLILLISGCEGAKPPMTIDTSTKPLMPSASGPAQNKVEAIKPGR